MQDVILGGTGRDELIEEVAGGDTIDFLEGVPPISIQGNMSSRVGWETQQWQAHRGICDECDQ